MISTQVLYSEYIEELKLDHDQVDSLLNKVKICSYLVCCGASIELESYPVQDKDFRTGNSGLQLSVGTSFLRALVPFHYMDETNPVKIRGDYITKQAVVEYAGKELFEVTILPDLETGNEHINLEFDTLIAAIPDEPYGTRSCCYHAAGVPCAFCVLGTKTVSLGPRDLVAAYEKISTSRGREPQVLLTGGTSNDRDRGLAKYARYVKELRSNFPNSRIAIEAAPPRDVTSLDTLIDLGMDTFAANIEFFSPEARDHLLPGKSAIALDEYQDVLTYCTSAGIRTFSAVIAGSEDEAETLRGVEFLAEIGTPTNLICLRPFPGAALQNQARVNPARFLRVTNEAVQIMYRYSVLDDLSHTAGCGSCGACAMEMNLYRLLRDAQADAILDSL
ncbi:MAG: radical SAM protein [Dehalococcoidia bacterium]|nr:MAG: radical SAM protein [Dehalococcoidia bacterium]